VTRLWIEW